MGRSLRAGLAETVKIFVLPPLASLALVVVALMALMNYQTQRNLQTTYVIKSIQRTSPCALCHTGTLTRLPALRLSLLPAEDYRGPGGLRSAAVTF